MLGIFIERTIDKFWLFDDLKYIRTTYLIGDDDV